MRSTKKITISLVVPVFNEEKRIHNLKKIDAYAHKNAYIKEIIVVDDGSTDETIRIVKKTPYKNRISIISYKENQGKGYAIKKGVLAAKGTHVIFIDVDLSTPLDTIGKVVKTLHSYDVVIGTRKNKHARLKKRQPMVREWMGKGFTRLSQMALGVRVTDFTCGFKCFTTQSAKKIFSKQMIRRWSFDAEALFLAKKYGYSIGELPVTWKNDPHTKVRFPQDILISLYELMLIVLSDWQGKY